MIKLKWIMFLLNFEEWDSLTSLSIIATIDADFNVNISAEQLLSINSTVGDLVNLIQREIKTIMADDYILITGAASGIGQEIAIHFRLL